MAVVHISEADLTRDIGAVLERVLSGTEVVIERDDKPVAVIKATPRPRSVSECIANAERRERERGYPLRLDPDFASDVEGIVQERKPWAPAWE